MARLGILEVKIKYRKKMAPGKRCQASCSGFKVVVIVK